MKELYAKWNANDEKNLQVVIVSGDRDEDGFKSTTEGMPWVALPFGSDKTAVNSLVPCTGFPTPGVIKGASGEVIDPDCFGKVDDANYANWLAAL